MNPDDARSPETRSINGDWKWGYYDWCNGRESLVDLLVIAGERHKAGSYRNGWNQAQFEAPHIARLKDKGN